MWNLNIYSLPIPVANANGVKAFSEYGISKILETLTLGKNRMCVESRKFLSFKLINFEHVAIKKGVKRDEFQYQGSSLTSDL